MILTRDKGQRMWGGGGGSSYSYGGGGGGESPSFDGFVSNEYYNQNFELLYKQEVTAGGTTTTNFMTAAPNIIVPVGTVTDETTQTTTVTSLVGPVAKNAIVLGNIMMVYDQTNNAIKVVNRDGSTAANFYATGGVSALGYNPGGGGGGGADLNALLDNINSSSIGDIAPTASEVGKCLVYNGNNQWAWATPGSGSGGIENVSVASAGLLTGGSVSGSTLTLTTRAIQAADVPDLSATYLTRARGMMFDKTGSYIAARFYVASGYDDTRLAAATGNNYIEWYGGDDNGWMNHAMGHLILTNTTQQIWSDTSGTKKFSLPSSSGTLATEGWVSSQNYITSSALSGYATESWVNNQGFVTSSGVTSVATGTGLTGGTITNTGTISINSTYNTYISHGQTAYGWGDHSTQGYLKILQGMRFYAQSNYIAARFSKVDGTYDSDRAALAQRSGYIEWWSDGGYFNHECGFIRAKGNVTVGTSTTDTSHYIQIGGARLYWDNTNNALKVIGSDGSSAVNFYSLGAVSALGMSSGTGGLSELTVNTLKDVSTVQNSGDITVKSTGTGKVFLNHASNAWFDTTGNLKMNSGSYYFNVNGDVKANKVYLSSTNYLYVASNHLYFNNGSTSIQIA